LIGGCRSQILAQPAAIRSVPVRGTFRIHYSDILLFAEKLCFSDTLNHNHGKENRRNADLTPFSSSLHPAVRILHKDREELLRPDVRIPKFGVMPQAIKFSSIVQKLNISHYRNISQCNIERASGGG